MKEEKDWKKERKKEKDTKKKEKEWINEQIKRRKKNVDPLSFFFFF